jgi:hypothetical protein
MAFDMNSDPWLNYHRTYQATLSSDGKSLSGTWAVPGALDVPMVYHRTSPVTLHMLQPTRDLYIDVADGVKDEVLDWGGSGRPMVLLAGQGVTARGWHRIIPDLVTKYHVYSITRRGYGNSSKPPPTAQNYSAERLGQDVSRSSTSCRLLGRFSSGTHSPAKNSATSERRHRRKQPRLST